MSQIRELLERGNKNLPKEPISEFYSFERQETGNCFMFEIRLKDGSSIAFPYQYIRKVKFETASIEVILNDTQITINGRNLNEIHVYLLKHRLIFVKEHDSLADNYGENDLFVSSIEIEEI